MTTKTLSNNVTSLCKIMKKYGVLELEYQGIKIKMDPGVTALEQAQKLQGELKVTSDTDLLGLPVVTEADLTGPFPQA